MGKVVLAAALCLAVSISVSGGDYYYADYDDYTQRRDTERQQTDTICESFISRLIDKPRVKKHVSVSTVLAEDLLIIVVAAVTFFITLGFNTFQLTMGRF